MTVFSSIMSESKAIVIAIFYVMMVINQDVHST